MAQQQQAQVFVTKPEAIRRLINAAILMFFRGDDELAVHCVAHSGLCAAQDLLSKRGKDVHRDAALLGLFEMLKAHARSELPEPIAQGAWWQGFVSAVSAKSPGFFERIKGAQFDEVKVELIGYNPAKFWREFRKQYNFLKHADRDAGHALDAQKINNDTALKYAVAAYVHLDLPLSNEMTTYWIYWNSLDPNHNLSLAPKFAQRVEKLSGYDIAERKRVCRFIIGDTSLNDDDVSC